MGKEKNAGNVIYLNLQTCTVSATLKMLSANAFNLDKAKILSFGKELYASLFGSGLNPVPNNKF